MNLLKTVRFLVLLASYAVFDVNSSALGNDMLLKTVAKQAKTIHWHTLNSSDAWGFTVESRLDNGNGKLQHRLQRYNPNLEPNDQWQLLEQENSKPSKAMLAEYANVQSSLQNNDEKVDINGLEIVYTVTLKLIENSNHYAIFSFKPRLPMFNDKINKVFNGSLLFNKTNKQIETLTVKASKPFSPGFSVNVDSYEMTIKIEKLEEQLHVTEIDSIKSGTAFVFSKFNERNTRKLTDFIAKEAR